ncbi:hypothetical protein ABKA04_003166 [Annulohypoxylon sp. FPYF3050]
MTVFADFFDAECEVDELRWYSRVEIGYYKERLDICTDDLIAYYRMEDTTNFDRQLVIDALDKIDELYSTAEAFKAKLQQEEQEEEAAREQQAREEEEALLEAEESSSDEDY